MAVIGQDSLESWTVGIEAVCGLLGYQPPPPSPPLLPSSPPPNLGNRQVGSAGRSGWRGVNHRGLGQSLSWDRQAGKELSSGNQDMDKVPRLGSRSEQADRTEEAGIREGSNR